jgi:hypothetical protein
MRTVAGPLEEIPIRTWAGTGRPGPAGRAVATRPSIRDTLLISGRAEFRSSEIPSQRDAIGARITK